MTLWAVTTSSASALRTSSGRPIRTAVVRVMDRQFKADDKVLRLIEGLQDDVSKMEEGQQAPKPSLVAKKKRTV